MQITRHLGHEVATKTRIALIMTVLPDTQDNDCLIVRTESMPPNLKEAFLHLLSSQEGQVAINLADVLARRIYSDTNKSMLVTLHEYGYLQRVPIDTIEMTPSPSMKIPLRVVLVESKIIKPAADAVVEKFNPHNYNSQAMNQGEAAGTARNLLAEAQMLEVEAKEKREKAYRLAPSLRPGGNHGAPEVGTLVTPDVAEPLPTNE